MPRAVSMNERRQEAKPLLFQPVLYRHGLTRWWFARSKRRIAQKAECAIQNQSEWERGAVTDEGQLPSLEIWEPWKNAKWSSKFWKKNVSLIYTLSKCSKICSNAVRRGPTWDPCTVHAGLTWDPHSILGGTHILFRWAHTLFRWAPRTIQVGPTYYSVGTRAHCFVGPTVGPFIF